MVFPHVALMQTNISRKRNKVTIHQLGESIKRDFKFKKKARRGERRRPPCTDKLSITRGSSEEQIRQPCQFPGEQMGSIRHPCPRASSPPHPQHKDPIQHVDGTHLKHQPEKEHHSNTGNNICMVLDDKLMAQHRRVLGGLLSDPHLGEIRPNFFFYCVAQRRCGRFLSDTVVVVECEDAQSSLLLPTSKGPGCN